MMSKSCRLLVARCASRSVSSGPEPRSSEISESSATLAPQAMTPREDCGKALEAGGRRKRMSAHESPCKNTARAKNTAKVNFQFPFRFSNCSKGKTSNVRLPARAMNHRRREPLGFSSHQQRKSCRIGAFFVWWSFYHVRNSNWLSRNGRGCGKFPELHL